MGDGVGDVDDAWEVVEDALEVVEDALEMVVEVLEVVEADCRPARSAAGLCLDIEFFVSRYKR